ncbi:MAG: hypothetical protein JXR37_34090 [Kiritimatiellae bacterium]|nr:hypothetical protein [Kiritimatiellia bacterium]
MKLYEHIGVSAVVSTGFYFATRSPGGAAACFLWGVLIDLDHVPDFFVNYGVRMPLKYFFRVFHQKLLWEVYVLLHAWEWTFAFAAAIWLSDWHPVAVGSFVGWLLHLMLDQMVNAQQRGTYFLIYRLVHGFTGEYFLTREERATYHDLKRRVRAGGGPRTALRTKLALGILAERGHLRKSDKPVPGGG